MEFFGRCAVRLVRFFGSFEIPYGYAMIVDSYSSCPRTSGFVEMYAFESRRVVLRFFSVLRILRVRSFAQIFPFIVRSIGVNMVNFVFRMLSGYHKPYQAVCLVVAPIQMNGDRSRVYHPPGYFTDVLPIPMWRSIFASFVSKLARVLVVEKNRPQIFGCKVVVDRAAICFVGASHSTLHKSFGQRRDRAFPDALSPRSYAMGVS